ncbi:hypothetical protein Pcinc_002136 [Petrolisthes cinctipes]|uniref:Uncharacterized protein n=1 Tax=Petrolisthes cinctipes TaxID=88211 RepID=A0AAE1GIU4_PETCI|nr:hypothetical protein Pcinc_002136 [Petrolisthes cinctipes]
MRINPSIAMTSAISPRNWNSSTIDTILKIGSRLYLLARQTINENFLCPPKVPKEFQSEEYRFTGTVEAEIGGGLTSESEQNLHRELVEFFSYHQAGVIVSCSSTSTFNTGQYWIFDSHSNDSKGRSTPQGNAIMMTFNTLDQLIDVLLSNLLPGQPFSLSTASFRVDVIELTCAKRRRRETNDNYLREHREELLLKKRKYRDQHRKEILQKKRKYRDQH